MSALRASAPRRRGFTLIELMITLSIVAILAAVALPSYRSYAINSSRTAVQSELVELTAIQEKIYLNSNAYTPRMTNAYTGSSAGGLGVTSGRSRDGKYTLSVTVVSGAYTLTATPVTGTSQAGDGALTINAVGSRTWGTKTW